MRTRTYLIVAALVVAAICASILIAGRNIIPTPTPSASPTATPSASPTATPSASPTASPSVTPSPSASATPTPTASPKIPTSLVGSPSFNSNPSIIRGVPVSWGFEVVPTGSAQILSVPVTVKIDNKAIGQVTPVGEGTETVAFSLTSAETNSLAAGQHTLTVSFAGDSTYQPSILTQTISVT